MSDYLAERGVNHRYQMFSLAGNEACERGVLEIIALAEAGKLQRRDLPEAVRRMCNKIEKTHAEVWDTEPQYQFAYELTKRLCEPQMWQSIDRWDW